jgi:SET domain-containing protein
VAKDAAVFAEPMSEVTPSAPPGLRIAAAAGRGRGVFATRGFRAGEAIERAPVIVFPRSQVRSLEGTVLDDYWFWWDEVHNAAALGCGSLYNHACPANARYERDHAARSLVFVAARDIAAGDEITINYHGDPNDAAPVWFATR